MKIATAAKVTTTAKIGMKNNMTELQNILIVDDEIDFARGLARMLSNGFPNSTVSTANNGAAALELIAQNPVSVMLLDLNMPGLHGLDVVTEVKSRFPAVTIVVLTAHGTVETAVSALKLGAWDFLSKPIRQDELLRAMAKALEHSKLITENQKLRKIMASSPKMKNMIGDSSVMQELRERIAAIASANYTVLIRGESGTGKEVIAENIHTLSQRSTGPFIKVNCPAIPEQLLESELFGHVKGAFTGATANHKGMFLQAENGTLLLDEVGDLPMGVQAKLLRALQDGEIRPVGSSKSTRINTRILAATNQDLEQKIRQGEFREDLFYRLNVLSIYAPPLRERKNDIPLLGSYFLVQSCAEMGFADKQFSPAALAAITQYDWPGNVRELQNFIRRQVVFSHDEVIETLHFSEEVQMSTQPEASTMVSYKDAKNNLLDSFTRNYMKQILEQTNGNISEAARLCGLERVSMQKILRRLEFDCTNFKR